MPTTPAPGVGGQFIRFAAIGTLGFCVDAGVLYFCMDFLGLGVYAGRAVSYLVAATTTWYLNRTLTFAGSDRTAPSSQWAMFVLMSGVGGVANYGVYSIIVWGFPSARIVPLLGVAAGSVAGLGFNFTMSRLFVFRGRHEHR